MQTLKFEELIPKNDGKKWSPRCIFQSISCGIYVKFQGVYIVVSNWKSLVVATYNSGHECRAFFFRARPWSQSCRRRLVGETNNSLSKSISSFHMSFCNYPRWTSIFSYGAKNHLTCKFSSLLLYEILLYGICVDTPFTSGNPFGIYIDFKFGRFFPFLWFGLTVAQYFLKVHLWRF